MKRLALLIVALCVGFVATPAAASGAVELSLPQGAAFAVLGHSCGGISEQVYATGFDASSGYPTGVAFLKTTCSSGGRGAPPSTFTAWASATWDFTTALVSSAKLASTPATNPTLTAYDASGNEVYNSAAHAYLQLAAGYVITPRITAISATIGPASGGTAVTISGTGFTAASSMDFGSVASAFTIVSDTAITTTSPASAAGTVDVTVSSAGGTSATAAADQFTFVAAPTITSISPTRGPTTGGTAVTITGIHLDAVSSVSFGEDPAGFVVTSDTSITATSPAVDSPDTTAVSVTSIGGTASTSSGAFTYVRPTVVAVTPHSGPALTAVTVSGSGFAAGEKVTVTYATGLSLPKSVKLCTVTATAAGSFSCAARIPSSVTAGALGSHVVKASGATSLLHAATPFQLT